MTILARNKKATHDYEIIETFEAGISLLGTEVKSSKAGKINFKDSFCKIENGELILYNIHISPYSGASIFNHDPERPRKLLLHKKEIRRLRSKVKQEGLTIIPLEFYVNNKGLIKVKIALAKGLKKYDKREKIAEKEYERRIRKQQKYENI
ncbi:SsrA-binding protein SmpB [Petrotoga halophila]|uniref:SsrA-binding protein n=1 Tax=Petrotoga halophila DSM 16923 TaxID=1122953 RepID=A0A2S5EJT3_9BACT|nr:SsrA-binding protein SmpB [Petrotoga halophila]POZ93315.1 single-stranded DNA-binding protein [Petrotoga halophila DSM 16923]